MMGRGVARMDIFRQKSDFDDFLGRLEIATGNKQAEVYAFALLSNHFHLLIRPLLTPLPTIMKRLLTGYAMRFNHRHERTGHVFQNRYKSILVEEERYLLQLIRYIHLNPIRSGRVETLEELGSWPYTGHAALLGQNSPKFVKVDETLSLFANTQNVARRRLLEFMADGLELEIDLEDSVTPANVDTANSQGDMSRDDRILGSLEFERKLLKLPNDRQIDCAPVRNGLSQDSLGELLAIVTKHYDLSVQELRSSSKRSHISKARHVIIWLGTKYYALSAAELARAINIRPYTVNRILLSRSVDLGAEAERIMNKTAIPL